MESRVIEAFQKKFNENPTFLVRAPGRVNLIGEHIDYSGYGVLPMAVEQSVYCAVKPTSDHYITLHNVDIKYDPLKADGLSAATNMLSSSDRKNQVPKWYMYFVCGVRGMAEHLAIGGSGDSLPGMEVMVGGNIPPSAGLSSSSALVCAAAVCTLRALTNHDFDKISRSEIAEMCAKCEHYIGTEGGGMDQAICLLAQPGEAKFIEFNPLRTTSVSLPNGASFVVANCCRDMNKAATPRYNERVVECRIAAQIIAQQLGLDWTKVRTLGQLQKTAGDKSFKEMMALVEKHLPNDVYSRDEVCRVLKITSDELVMSSLNQNTTNMMEFRLKARALHVYSEAGRVYEFADICNTRSGEEALVQLGQLMDASHASCRDWFECSCPELDQLQQAAKKVGALGSRLTGAGWGGCTVSLIKSTDTKQFIEKLRSTYFANVDQKVCPFEEAVFATEPAGCAEIKFI